MNKQRENVYALRRELLEGKIRFDDEGDDGDEVSLVDSREYLMTLAENSLHETISQYCGDDTDPEEWDIGGLKKATSELFALEPERLEAVPIEEEGIDQIQESLWDVVLERYLEKEQLVEPEILRRVERDVMLQVVDVQWKDHLYGLDHLKEGIALRGYGQRDPLVEYKRESFAMFQAMKTRIDEDTVKYLWRLRPVAKEGSAGPRQPAIRRATPLSYNAPSAALAGAFPGAGGGDAPRPARTGGDDAKVKTVRREVAKVGRNDPCPCGSGKKYKKCHGA